MSTVKCMFCMSTMKCGGPVHPTLVMDVLTFSHVKIMLMGIYQEYGEWYGNKGKLPRLVLT